MKPSPELVQLVDVGSAGKRDGNGCCDTRPREAGLTIRDSESVMQMVAAAGRVELPLHVVALAQSYPCPRGKVFAARRIETIWQ